MKRRSQGFDEITGEHGGYEMGVRGSSNYFLLNNCLGFFII